MFEGDDDANDKATEVVAELGDHALTKSHNRHIAAERAEEIGLDVTRLESDDDLQDAVLSVHHSTLLTFSFTSAVKIIENQEGSATIRQARVRDE